MAKGKEEFEQPTCCAAQWIITSSVQRTLVTQMSEGSGG